MKRPMKGGRRRSGRPNLTVVAGLALGLIVVAAVAVWFFARPPAAVPESVPAPANTAVTTNAPTVQEVAPIDVLVSTQNIEEGSELKPVLFRKETRPAVEFAQTGVVGNFDQLTGTYAKSFVAAGQPLLAEHLTLRPPINSVVPQIRVGHRAITIKLDKQATNEGWARAGVRVDVLWAWKQGAVTQASIIAQNLRVLSSGTSVSSDFGGESRIIQDGESTVTLEVSTEDQKRLKLASGKGELRLLLRGDEDTGEISEKTKTSVEAIIASPNENSKAPVGDQGWVVIDGRKYRVVGTALIPG